MASRHSGTSCDTTYSHRDAHRVMHAVVTGIFAARPPYVARSVARYLPRTEHAAGSLAQVGGGECRGRLQESAQFTPRCRRCDAAHNSCKSLRVKTEQAVSTS